MLLPVVMAGGSGTRLWPLSRTLFPKQFLSLTSSATMLQETLLRLSPLDHQPAFLVCNQEHRFIVAEQLRKANLVHGGIALEPVGRNTAPAVAIAALHARAKGEDPLLLVLAADHVIAQPAAFCQAVQAAMPLAEQGQLVTFGIVPTAPETGYGYIQQGDTAGLGASKVAAFVEKPNLELAQQYLSDGRYLWNSGMFLFKASVYLNELVQFCPQIVEQCQQALQLAQDDLDFIRLDPDSFAVCPDDSIDYAVMEKTANAVVMPLDASWSDVGSWSALWDVSEKDAQGNVLQGDVLTEQTHNSFIYAQHRLTAAVGIDDMVVVETKDAVLVAHKDRVQDIKGIVSQLKAANRAEQLQHREVFRPWGSHDAIADGERYHVKQVMVKPGQKTAVQIHYHRAEHWIIVSGTARVTRGDEIFLISENESTYIPLGIAHSIENPGKIPLEIIEVRTGIYLAEDDIVRIPSTGVGY
ncbi:mannose-1-phosphate guanylyltransferase/mannose-6-phosphate isomerase [Aeromonas hydrophila]|uniref:mannose-1-phosphate guanylyltransferase/mannose-6-phosphate isomerase n=1 Tax=Aeromonas hydrophila TaxID=644 RepID=UPI00191EA6CD|nr:mannose-1-phosphate guanylyltransferase/mannose-6-phosphate isomerase [Aeromonas hydrophila]MBL0575005.1 mannose-1-phosphate guanylyltransferase/mannose-6-phosphate isomerase [Aeromonas hydrophila]WVM46943.1 mannose-1-phosphate guanylyltransferase/mannose-6-phosphate isomerase [Aeromonas hydrophila]